MRNNFDTLQPKMEGMFGTHNFFQHTVNDEVYQIGVQYIANAKSYFNKNLELSKLIAEFEILFDFCKKDINLARNYIYLVLRTAQTLPSLMNAYLKKIKTEVDKQARDTQSTDQKTSNPESKEDYTQVPIEIAISTAKPNCLNKP